jgi:hypothetical protein
LSQQVKSLAVQDAQLVSRAFGTFQQTYKQDVQAVLVPPGTTDPSANRAAFDQAVGAALSALDATIDGAVGDLSGASSLEATIRAELLGGGSGTLQGQLAAIPTPASVGSGDVQAFKRAGAQVISQMTTVVTQQILSVPSPSGGVGAQTLQQDLNLVRGAFQTLSRTYSSDIRTVLLPPGTIDPSANRPAFDRAVGAALSALDASIDSDLGNLPAAVTAALDTIVRNNLLNNGSNAGNNLQSRLAALPSPTSAQGALLRVFQSTSTLTINTAQAQVKGDVQIAVAQYNASLTSG